MSESATTPVRHVRCPSCGTASLFMPANPWRPFCSTRCAGVDLGAWAQAAYRVGAPQATDEIE